MKRVLVVEDHGIVREGLKRILGDMPGGVRLGEADSMESALQLLQPQPWDLIVLDLQLPGMSGIEGLAQILRQRPDTPVLVLSMFPEEQYAVRMLKAGAAGYLAKEAAHEDLLNACERIFSGHKVMSERVTKQLIGAIGKPTALAPHDDLTAREFQIFRLIASGSTPREIAWKLGISVKTVGAFRGRILKKMACGSTAELAVYAAKHRLLT